MNQPDRFALFNRPMPPGYRDELQALIAEPAAEPGSRDGSMLLFQLGELRLALPTRIAFAVAPVLHIAPIPHRRETVLLGLVAFRGDILPCCSLARILELPQQPSSSPRTLILEESAGRRWAVPIDAVSAFVSPRGRPTASPRHLQRTGFVAASGRATPPSICSTMRSSSARSPWPRHKSWITAWMISRSSNSSAWRRRSRSMCSKRS